MKETIFVTPTTDIRHRKQYSDAGSIVAHMACAEINDLNLEETVYLWSCLAMVIKDIDDCLDNLDDEDKRKEYADKILVELFAEDHQQFENREFNTVMTHIDNLGNQAKRRAMRYGKLLFLATEKVKKAKNQKEYSKFVAVEGALTMEFLISLLLISEAQKNEVNKFKKWSKQGAAMGNLFDSLIDLKSDKKNGLFKELPFLNTSLNLINDMTSYLLRVLPHVPKRYLFRVILGHLKAIFIKR